MKAGIETVILIPVADNDGNAFTLVDWRALHQRIGSFASGSTRRGPHQGQWEHGGQVYSEPVFEFEIDLDSWFATPAFLDTVQWAQSHFRQLAIMFKVAGIPETFPP